MAERSPMKRNYVIALAAMLEDEIAKLVAEVQAERLTWEFTLQEWTSLRSHMRDNVQPGAIIIEVDAETKVLSFRLDLEKPKVIARLQPTVPEP